MAREGATTTYFVWAARLREPVGAKRGEDIGQLVGEAQALVNTYLDGAGLVAWRTRTDGLGYEVVPLPRQAQISTLDDVLYRIPSEIEHIIKIEERIPAPQTPDKRAVNFSALDSDITE